MTQISRFSRIYVAGYVGLPLAIAFISIPCLNARRRPSTLPVEEADRHA